MALPHAWPCWWSACNSICGQRNSPYRCPDLGPPQWSRTKKRRPPRWIPLLWKEEAPTVAFLELEAFWKIETIASWRHGKLLIHLEPNGHSHNQEIEPQNCRNIKNLQMWRIILALTHISQHLDHEDLTYKIYQNSIPSWAPVYKSWCPHPTNCLEARQCQREVASFVSKELMLIKITTILPS